MRSLPPTSRPRRFGRLAPVALAATVALAGCGGGGSSHLSQAQYAAKANAVCVRLAARISAIGAEKGSFPAKARQVIAPREQALAELRAIPPFAGDKLKPLWMRTRAKAIADLKESVKHGPLSELSAPANRAYFEEFRRAQLIARALHATKCVGTAAT